MTGFLSQQVHSVMLVSSVLTKKLFAEKKPTSSLLKLHVNGLVDCVGGVLKEIT